MSFITAENQYNQFSDINKAEVLKLLEWTKQQSHLPNVDEIEGIIFLYSCYNSLELAKQTVDLYYTTRTLCPEFFAKRDVLGEDMKRAMSVCAIAPLPYKTSNGDKIIISKLIHPDPNEFIFVDVVKLYFMYFDLWMMEEGTAEGHILAVDMENTLIGHVLRLSPFVMKKFLFYLQEACPVRIKGFHFINTVPFMDKVLAIMKPFMKKELLSVLHLHQSMETFHQHVSKEFLPQEYGGLKENFSSYTDRFNERLIKNRDFFLNEEKIKRVDEKQRPGKPKSASDLFGAEGNFKKLDID